MNTTTEKSPLGTTKGSPLGTSGENQRAPAHRFSPGERTPITLDDLASRSCEELEALYRAAPAPQSMRAADGPRKGRMLAVAKLDHGSMAELLRRLAASRSFVWEGKTFTADGDREGRGVNRIRLPHLLGRQNLFPFATRFAPSALDGRDALVLDYDRPENPPLIRRIHDEIREVSPGVFLGPAMWKSAAGLRTVLWFALGARAVSHEPTELVGRAPGPRDE
jgi:hypothetical protein